MSQAAVEGLAVERETAQRRAKQEAALAQARARATAKSTTSKLSGSDKKLMEMFADRVKSGEDLADVAADFNRDVPGSGDRILTYLQSAPLGGGGVSGSTPMTPIEKARRAIRLGAPRQDVVNRLVAAGVDPGDL